MNSQNIATIINDNKLSCGYKFNVSRQDGTSEVMRLFVSQYGTICYFAKGSRSRGYALYDLNTITDIQPVKKQATSPAAMLLKNAKKAAQLLEASGLWPELLAKFKGLASLSETEAEEVLSLAGAIFDARYNTPEKSQAYAAYNGFFEARNIPVYSEYHISQLADKGQIVSVPYDKWERDRMRQLVAGKIDEAVAGQDKDFRFQSAWYGSYDYSVSVQTCKDGQPRAWYSAEYKNCGNGHYYLLLDASHALFYEND